MADPGPIRDVVVAGGGIVGWSAAAALKRKLPNLRVVILPSPPPPDALTELIASTLPSIVGFHSDLGLSDEDAVVRARSAVRLGTEFVGWNAGLPPYVHGYAPHGAPFGTTSFHHQWLRLAGAGSAAPFDAYSAAAALGRAGRFADAASPDLEFGLALDLPRYAEMMRAFALHFGVEPRHGQVGEVVLRQSDGFIDRLRLDGGADVAGDLFVDATGPRALLRSKLDSRFDDWSRWLPCDRVMVAEAAAEAAPALLDTVEAVSAGWRWRSAALGRTSHGLAYRSDQLDDTDAERLLAAAGARRVSAPVSLRQGRRPEPWLRNCVAIGEAAVTLEPLEWTGLHLAHSAIDRIVSMMPGRDCAPVELEEHNRQAQAEAERVRDFLMLHYIAARRSEPFWTAAAAAEPPSSLSHTLSLFEERGRLPYHEEETFSRDSWLAVLLGQGVMPRRVDPLAESLPLDAARRALDGMRSGISALAAKAPAYSDYIRNQMRQPAR